MNGETLSGQTYQPEKNRVLPYVQQSVEYSGPETLRVTGEESTTAIDINPTDKTSALVRRYDISAIVTALEAEVLKTPVKLAVSELPAVLTEVVAQFNKSSGTGASNFPVSQQNFQMVNSGSGNISPKATAQASAAILAEATWTRKDHYRAKVVNGTAYTFNIASQTVTIAQILTRLTTAAGATVNDYPNFNPVEHQISCKGAQISVQANASSNVSGAQNTNGTSYSYSWEYGDGYSKEVGVSTKVENIPLSIHAGLTIASNTDSASVSVEVVANTAAVSVGAVPVIVPAITNEPAAVTGTANAEVLFENGTATVAATTGVTAIPVTGLYLVPTGLQGQQDDFGVTQIRAIVVDFSQYA